MQVWLFIHRDIEMPIPLVKLPSLDLIKGFVAVGRRMSVTEAADDLFVTQSAMSKQLRGLEDALGVRLFERGYRRIAFTEHGLQLFKVADASVRQLQHTLTDFSERTRQPVTITASTGVSGLWLLPRLSDFQLRFPQIDLRVVASNLVVDPSAGQIDLSIRYCPERHAPRGAIKLFGETIAPVASPALDLSSFDCPQDLEKQVLLEYDDSRRPWLQWGSWLEPMNWNGMETKGMLRFNQYEQMIQAAIGGRGIALGRLELLSSAICSRRLRILAPHRARASPCAYWLIQAEAAARRDARCVVDWIVASCEPLGAPAPDGASNMRVSRSGLHPIPSPGE